MLRDAFWQLHCELTLSASPELVMERHVRNDRFYQFLERTWMAQQIPLAIFLFAVGGLPWVVWGIAVRVSTSVTGHWLVGFFAHNRGPRNWQIEGAGVQGYNVPYCSLITMGESWHNNHHAFPSSARFGGKDEFDPGWWVLSALQYFGLVWNIKTPEVMPYRTNLLPVKQQAGHSK